LPWQLLWGYSEQNAIRFWLGTASLSADAPEKLVAGLVADWKQKGPSPGWELFTPRFPLDRQFFGADYADPPNIAVELRKAPPAIRWFHRLGSRLLATGMDPEFGPCIDFLLTIDRREVPTELLRLDSFTLFG
jgi:hypothetical protein